MSFGLLGNNIAYSYSPLLHNIIGHYEYSLIDIKPNELKTFIDEGNFSGLNITIPFKEKVINLVECDELSKNLGSCNTIYRRDGKLIGTNTDFFGFLYLLSYHKIDLSGKKVLILGGGGASKTICYASQLLRASKIFLATRQEITQLKNKLDYVEYLSYNRLPKNVDIIINTTPLGSQNHIDLSPLTDLSYFEKCESLIDLNYNPYRTKLMYLAEKSGIKTYNGLAMLVAQGTKSAEFFLGVNFLSYNNKIIKLLSQLTQNIILIGMSGVGKSHIGKLLSVALKRPYVDTDELIEKECSLNIDSIFKHLGESYFREVESRILRNAVKGNGQIIATGGGSLENEANLHLLQSKAIIIHLDREIDEEEFDKIFLKEPRPLYDNFSSWNEVYKKRYKKYEELAQIHIKNTSEDETLNKIIERINKYYEKTYINK